MLEEIILPSHWQVQLDKCEVVEGLVVLEVHLTYPALPCPECSYVSGRVHSRYCRQPADLPLNGQTVRLALTVRRFFCDNASCSRRTFVEQAPALLQRQARRTLRQYNFLAGLAFALGGRPGVRQAARQGVKISRTTLLRLIRKTPLPSAPTPRILGVDDWAFRKGVSYGTILIGAMLSRSV
jgi:transposase